MRPWLDRMDGWLWIGAFLLAAVAIAFLWRVARYLVKRVFLLVKLTAAELSSCLERGSSRKK